MGCVCFCSVFLQPEGRMVSVTQKSRSCVLLLFSLISVRPVLSLSVLRTAEGMTPPVINPNMSLSVTFTTPSILKSSTSTITPMSMFKTSVTALYPSKSVSTSSTMPVPLFNQTSATDLLITSPKASKSVFFQFGKKGSLSPNPVQCPYISGPTLQFLKQIFPNIPRLLPHSCKCQTPFKYMLHNKFPSPWPKICLYPYSLHPAKPLRFTNTPLHHEKLIFPSQTASPSPPTTSPVAFLSLPSETSPPPFAKISHNPTLKTSSAPPVATNSHQPQLPPAPPPLPHTAGPLFENQPFIVSWNIPDLVCNRHKILLDTSPFKGVATPAKVRWFVGNWDENCFLYNQI